MGNVGEDQDGLFRVCRLDGHVLSLHLHASWAIKEAETRACICVKPSAFAVHDPNGVRIYTAMARKGNDRV